MLTRERAVLAHAAPAALLCAAVVLLPPGLLPQLALLAGTLLGAAGVVVGIRRHRPVRPLGWWLLGSGLVARGVGDVVQGVSEALGRDPSPSPADATHLAAHLLVAGGLVLHLRERARGARSGTLLDAAVVVSGLVLLAWVVVVEPVLAASSAGGPAHVVGVAHLLCDVLLLGLLVPHLALPGGRSTSAHLLGASLVAVLAADAAHAHLVVVPGLDAAGASAVHLASSLLLGAAALHPTMREAGAAPVEVLPAAGALTRRRTAALVTAVLVAPGVLTVQLLLGDGVSGWPVVVATVVMVLLVVARTEAAVRAVARAAHEREVLQARVAHEAAHDPLTGLPNRARALAVLEMALHAEARARRDDGRAAGLLLVDLDRFTQVNDRFGPCAGDAVLRGAAERLRALVRADDLVGRLGADEFVVVLGRRTEEELRETADLVVVALAVPLLAQGQEVRVGASVGATLASRDCGGAPAVLGDAVVALGRAKRGGRGRAVVADAPLRRELDEQAQLEAALREGLAAGELLLHYQPVHDVASGAVTGYEALVRWDRPGHGPVPPDDFVPVAERSDLVCDLDRWVLAEATRQMAAWTAADPVGFAGRTVAVNVSGRHLARRAVVDSVAQALRRSGLAPAQLVVEITETVLVDASTACEHLAAIRALGVAVSIDDFGTGYTSMAQLQHLPADTLKVDRSFVSGGSPAARDLLALMVHAGHAAGLVVLAEGVEEAAQLDDLRALGCDLAQGFLLARPLRPDQVPAHGSSAPPSPVPVQVGRRRAHALPARA
ncbi:bifunctional diguanylate cyclase/phosphodiesterase [uncultured Pseudokineococcus sp.]|uniref:putative bifunctional diguanylate cyclase/phosphodiesterase n=1 Tax=uncultured Pseudokineococcus sp. TaxID=1642928 RepID=UPI00262143B3|nr:bifunctional diguanylate cyclase/phosphodiesterase [uncultured Pseudokineococcus sp.]